MIIFLYGSDTFRSRLKLKELRDRFIKEVDPLGSSLTVLDGESLTMNKLNEAAGSPSLFSKKRMIIVERVFAAKNKELADELAQYLAKKFTDKKKSGDKPDEENMIVFWDEAEEEGKKKNKLFQFLLKQKFSFYFKMPSNTEAAAWVKTEVEKRGGKIKLPAAAHLVSLFGIDLWQLNNEIDKLVNYKSGQTGKLLAGGEEPVIEIGDIELMARGSSDANIFALTDAISHNNKPKALALFESELEAGVNDIYLLTMIQRQFRILLQVRQALDQGSSQRQIMSDLGLHPFVAQKALNQVSNFSLPVLKRIFQALVNIDRQIKTGQIDLKSAFSLLMAKI
jgi:DNA polymerase-3 subunit delta